MLLLLPLLVLAPAADAADVAGGDLTDIAGDADDGLTISPLLLPLPLPLRRVELANAPGRDADNRVDKNDAADADPRRGTRGLPGAG